METQVVDLRSAQSGEVGLFHERANARHRPFNSVLLCHWRRSHDAAGELSVVHDADKEVAQVGDEACHA